MGEGRNIAAPGRGKCLKKGDQKGEFGGNRSGWCRGEREIVGRARRASEQASQLVTAGSESERLGIKGEDVRRAGPALGPGLDSAE